MVNHKFLADTQTSKTIWDLLLPITAPQATGEGKGYTESDVGGARTDARSLQSGYTTSLTNALSPTLLMSLSCTSMCMQT